jgi:ribosomal protein S18 acetylase RimI-like enzyme
VGQIILKRWWNMFAWVDDIRVSSEYRRSGVGKALMDAAVGWARINGYPGIKLETSDINVPACSFYSKYGFIFSGMDTLLYHAGENPHETAMFWYFLF